MGQAPGPPGSAQRNQKRPALPSPAFPPRSRTLAAPGPVLHGRDRWTLPGAPACAAWSKTHVAFNNRTRAIAVGLGCVSFLAAAFQAGTPLVRTAATVRRDIAGPSRPPAWAGKRSPCPALPLFLHLELRELLLGP